MASEIQSAWKQILPWEDNGFHQIFLPGEANSKDCVNLITSDDEVGLFLADTFLPEVTNYNLSPADVSKLLKLKFKKSIDAC